MYEIEKKRRNLNNVGNKKKVRNWKMQEIRISRKWQKVGNHKKVGNPKKQQIGKSRKSEIVGKITEPLRFKKIMQSLETKKSHNLSGLK